MNKGIQYHMGLVDNNKLPYGYKTSNTVTVYMVTNVDLFPPYLWLSIGEALTTKTHQRIYKESLLAAINKQYGTSFAKIVIQ